jgi:hypothetical protein
MATQERYSLTSLPNESLSTRYYPERPESPTLGHLHALLAVANGYPIDEEVKQAVLNSASRFGEHLERAIDSWNRQASRFPEIRDERMRKLAFHILQDAMILSYGSPDVDPEERRKLIKGAIELLNTNISPN